MDLYRHLRYFDALARHLHFRDAADELDISQPALSQRIRQLEQYVGASLFDRSTRSVSLTPAGHALLHSARRAIGAVEEFTGLASQLAAADVGMLRLGVPSSVRGSVVAAVVHALTPFGVVELRSSINASLVNDVRRGGLELAIVRGPVDLTGVTSTTLSGSFGIAVAETHPLATVDDWSPSDVSGRIVAIVDDDQPAHAIAALGPALGLADPLVGRVASELVAVHAELLVGRSVAVCDGSSTLCDMAGVTWRPLATAPARDVIVVRGTLANELEADVVVEVLERLGYRRRRVETMRRPDAGVFE